MTTGQLLNVANKKLSKTSDSATLDSEVLLSFVLNKPKEYLATNPKNKVDRKLENKYLTLINRRSHGWPIAYLTRQKEFYGLNFYVDKNVLVPRPETEGLVELVLGRIKDLGLRIKDKHLLSILDIGTGSGNIIISIAKALEMKRSVPIHRLEPINGRATKSKFFASDISNKALTVAKKNAKLHKVKITFKQGSLLEPWKNKKFDVIIANLPYLHRETDTSTKFEPKGALIAEKKGLDLYEKLFKQVSALTPLPSTLFLETGHDQSNKIKNLAKKYLPNYSTEISKDLFGRTRYALLVRKLS